MITLPYEYKGTATGKTYTILGWTDFLRDRLRVKDDEGRIWELRVSDTAMLLNVLKLTPWDIPYDKVSPGPGRSVS